MSEQSECFHPGGMAENSPAFQRWDRDRAFPSPEGTAEPVASQPSLRDLSLRLPLPGVETLGYCRMSLRDKGAGPFIQILRASDRNVRAPASASRPHRG